MKSLIVSALGGLLIAVPSAFAQLPVGTATTVTQGAPYGAVSRPQYPRAQPAKKPIRVAQTTNPSTSAQRVSMQQHSPTVRQAQPATVRTAQNIGYGAMPSGYASQPMPPTIPAPVQGQAPAVESSVEGEAGGCGEGCGAGGCGYPYGPCRRTPLLFGWYVPFWHSMGDMPQHYPYFPNAHGYYYFRPYNVIHINQQQEMVARWGLDPRNPLDNRFFERIYQEQEALQGQGTASAPAPFMPR